MFKMVQVRCTLFLTVLLSMRLDAADVNYNNGQLQFSRTLFTAKSHHLTLPVNLDYDSHITTRQHATWAGMGFDVDVPYIERQVVGAPDEAYSVCETYNNPLDYTTIDAMRSILGLTPTQLLFIDYYNASALVESNHNGWTAGPPPSNGTGDLTCCDLGYCILPWSQIGGPGNSVFDNATRQDVYTLHHFPGGGGRLFFSTATDAQGKLKAAVAPFKPWQISYGIGGGALGSWVIRDENGTEYTFNQLAYRKDIGIFRQAELTSSPDLIGGTVEKMQETNPYVFRWYLSSMRSYDGDEITVQYAPESKTTFPQDLWATGERKWDLDPENARSPSQAYLNVDINCHTTRLDITKRSIIAVEFDDDFETDLRSPIVVRRLVSYVYQGMTHLKVDDANALFTWLGSVNIKKITLIMNFDPSVGGPPTGEQVWQWRSIPDVLYCGAYLYTVPAGRAEDVNINGDLFSPPSQYEFDCLRGDATTHHLTFSQHGGGYVPSRYLQSIFTNDGCEIYGVRPVHIITPLQQIDFTEAARSPTDLDPVGRGRLSQMVLRNASGEALETLDFAHELSGVCGKLQLTSIQSTRNSTTKMLYQFGYQTQPISQDGDKFGSYPAGMVNRMIDINGKVTNYTYERATFKKMTDGQTVLTTPALCGFRVNNVIETDLSGTKPVSTNILYDLDYAEIPYTDAFNMSKGPTPASHADANVCFDGGEVNYGKVTTSVAGAGRRVYEYLTTTNSNGLGLVDEQNEYNINSYYRNRLFKESDFADGATQPVRTVSYTYNLKSYGGSSAYRYSKPPTCGRQYEALNLGFLQDQYQPCNPLGDLCEQNRVYCLTVPSRGVAFLGQLGYPGADIVISADLQLTSVVETVNGVAKRTDYSYNDAPYGTTGIISGLVKWKTEYLGNEQRITSYGYGYQAYPAAAPYSVFSAGNLLTPVVGQTIDYNNPTTDVRATVAANIDCWGDFNGVCYPSKSYVWREDHRDASGLPTPAYDRDEFNFTTNTGSNRWQIGKAVTSRNSKGYAQDVYFAPDHLWSTTVYRNDKYYPIAQVTRARKDWVGIFTCDYDVTPAPVDDRYFDQDNGWLQGGALLVTPPADKKHFGEKVVQVTNRNGPTKDITVMDPSRDYILSAWVCPLNTNPVRLVVEPHPHGTSTSDFDDAATGLVQNQWQFVTKKITGPELRSHGITGTIGDYLTVWVGCKVGENTNLYVDDIRFYPADALVTTSYFDWRGNVICTVDANDKPKFFTYDGWDRVSSIKNSKGQLVQSFDYHLQGDVP